MHRKNIKSGIWVMLLVVLHGSILTTTLVVFVLWYQHGVNVQLQKAKSIIEARTGQDERKIFGYNLQEGEGGLEFVKSLVGDDCIFIRYIKDDNISQVGESYAYLIDGVEPYWQTSAVLVWNIVKMNASWSLLGVGPKYTILGVKLGAGEGVELVIDTVKTFDDIVKQMFAVLMYVVVNSIVFSTIAFFRIEKIVLKPLDSLVYVARSYKPDNEIVMFPDNASSALGHLSQSMNNMLLTIDQDREKLKNTIRSLAEANSRLMTMQEEIVRTEKLAATGRLSIGLAHEIGNPISIVKGYLELLAQNDVDVDDRYQYVTRSLSELDRIDSIIRRLMVFARESDRENSEIDVSDLITGIVELISLPAAKIGAVVKSIMLVDTIKVYGDEQLLRQVILNLLLNSLDGVKDNDGRKKIWVIANTLSNRDKIGREEIVLTIADNGNGITEKNLKYIFEPFFTTKPLGEGTGLGLAVSYQTIKALGGKIDVESEVGVGTMFDIILPVVESGKLWGDS